MKPFNSVRVVVTGLGVVSANGSTLEAFWKNIKNGKTAIDTVRSFDTSAFNSDRGCEITDFNVADHIPDAKAVLEYGRAKQMGLVAAQQCIFDSKFEVAKDPFRVGVVVGITMGESKSLEFCTDMVAHNGMVTPPPADKLADYPPNTIPQAIGKFIGAFGPNMIIPNACAAGNFTIGYALDCFNNGEVDAMIVGGTDAFSRYAYSGFARLGAIAPDLPRPFSIDRQGMVPGEGAAMLFLESLESARKRDVPIYAEIVGYGESCDAYHITQPDDKGIAQAIQKALSMARIKPKAISFISAHGTGTKTNDAIETKALKRIFDPVPPLTSVKSMIGHAMGASGSIDCVAALLSMRNGYITPTANWIGFDPECDVDCVPNVGRSTQVEYVLKTSSAFGGNNSALIFKRIV